MSWVKVRASLRNLAGKSLQGPNSGVTQTLLLRPHLEAQLQGVAEVLCDFVDADAAHGPDSQGPDERVWVASILQQARACLPSSSVSGYT